MIQAPDLPALVLELGRVLVALPRVEAGRRWRGPKPLLEKLRRRGRQAKRRGRAERARLRRAVGLIDRLMPGGPNCSRRALLEIALDRGAAHEPFRMGFRVGPASISGHAWLGAEGGPSEGYQVQLEL